MGIINFLFGNDNRAKAQRDQWNPFVVLKNAISPINDYGTCFRCEGTGRVTLECRACHGTGTHDKPCFRCQKTGKKRNKPCEKCAGTGIFSECCRKCNGVGHFTVTCKKCDGSGWHKFKK